MIETQGLRYRYAGGAELTFPDFSMDMGETLLVRGESGCGKTTLLHLLAGLLRPLAGSVRIAGTELTECPPARLDRFRGRHIGMVYQNAYFVATLKVIDNLLLSPYAGSRAAAEVVAQRLGIGELLNRYPHQLSTGQRQRASIARAVMCQPRLLLADEPTSALDDRHGRQVVALLQEEAAANEAALVIVTHDGRLREWIDRGTELHLPSVNVTTV